MHPYPSRHSWQPAVPAAHSIGPQHAAPVAPSTGKKLGRAALEIFGIIASAAVIALFLRAFVVQVYKIPSESMNDTMQVGSRIVVNHVPGWGKQVERGDIVVFRDSESWLTPVENPQSGLLTRLGTWFGFTAEGADRVVVKRVIGVGGDTVTCCDASGRLSVNGEPVDEPYLAEGAIPSEAEFSIVVPEGTYWVMGDNRQNSADSRFHYDRGDSAFIPKESIIGRAQWEIWPITRWSYLGNRNVFSAVPDATDQ